MPYGNAYVNPYGNLYARKVRTPCRLDGGIAAGEAPEGKWSGRAERCASRD